VLPANCVLQELQKHSNLQVWCGTVLLAMSSYAFTLHIIHHPCMLTRSVW
jgi:hypothetical protein